MYARAPAKLRCSETENYAKHSSVLLRRRRRFAFLLLRLILEITQAEFLQQARDVVWMPADNLGHLFAISVGFFEGFEQTAAHRLARRTVQGFLVEEGIAVGIQRTFQIINVYDPARTEQDGAMNDVPKLTHVAR